MLKKFNMDESKATKTSMHTLCPLTKYEIDSLLYLTISRPNIMHNICLCGRYQSKIVFFQTFIREETSKI